MTKSLPEQPDLGQLKKQAKELLEEVRLKEASALARIGKESPSAFALNGAQLVIARELGFPSWAKLKLHIETRDETAAEPALIKAALEGKRRKAAQLLATYPSLASKNIFVAATLGDPGPVLEWLKKDPSLVRERGGPNLVEPIIYACFSQAGAGDTVRSETVRILIERGADPNSWRGDPFWPDAKETALYGATGLNDYPKVARVLLSAGANPNDGESRYHSPERNHVASLEVLAEFKTDFSRADNQWGNTPLYFLLGHYPGPQVVRDGIRWLLEHGANPNIPAYTKRQNEVPLHLAVRNDWGAEMIALFLQHGADPTIKRADGRTAYDLAVRGGHIDVARVLTEKTGKMEASAVDHFLGACMRADEPEARSWLLRDPGIVDSMTTDDRMIMHQAAREGRADAIRLMGSLGFDVNIKGAGGETALHAAGHAGRAEAMRALVEQGADVNVEETHYKATPLGWVAHGSQNNKAKGGDYPAAAGILLSAGAVLTPDMDGSPEVMDVFKAYRNRK